jgi:hypothetical protein
MASVGEDFGRGFDHKPRDASAERKPLQEIDIRSVNVQYEWNSCQPADQSSHEALRH